MKSLELPHDFLEKLSLHSWATSDTLFPHSLCKELKNWGEQALKAGQFKEAKIGVNEATHRDAKLRGDSILWLNDEPAKVLKHLHQIKELCKAELMLPIASFETHLAYYPPGSAYERHLDQSPKSTARLLSFVLYLNEDWQKGDGGELRVEGQDSQSHLIEPIFGRFIMFRSDLIYHSVLPTLKPRFSLTGWMRRSTL